VDGARVRPSGLTRFSRRLDIHEAPSLQPAKKGSDRKVRPLKGETLRVSGRLEGVAGGNAKHCLDDVIVDGALLQVALRTRLERLAPDLVA
jgi:hypothetical protein